MAGEVRARLVGTTPGPLVEVSPPFSRSASSPSCLRRRMSVSKRTASSWRSKERACSWEPRPPSRRRREDAAPVCVRALLDQSWIPSFRRERAWPEFARSCRGRRRRSRVRAGPGPARFASVGGPGPRARAVRARAATRWIEQDVESHCTCRRPRASGRKLAMPDHADGEGPAGADHLGQAQAIASNREHRDGIAAGVDGVEQGVALVVGQRSLRREVIDGRAASTPPARSRPCPRRSGSRRPPVGEAVGDRSSLPLPETARARRTAAQ